MSGYEHLSPQRRAELEALNREAGEELFRAHCRKNGIAVPKPEPLRVERKGVHVAASRGDVYAMVKCVSKSVARKVEQEARKRAELEYSPRQILFLAGHAVEAQKSGGA